MNETAIFRLNLLLFAVTRITEISVEINGATGHDVGVQTGWAELVVCTTQRLPVIFMDFIYWCRYLIASVL